MAKALQLVIVESPYGSRNPAIIRRNARYVCACLRDCFLRGEIPFASHGIYTLPGVLRDEIPVELAMGIEAGFVIGEIFGPKALRAFYLDYGISHGMDLAVAEATRLGQTLQRRWLGTDWDTRGRDDVVRSNTAPWMNEDKNNV